MTVPQPQTRCAKNLVKFVRVVREIRELCSTVVHGWISTCIVAEELESSSKDDACECWWLVACSQYIGGLMK